MSTLNSLRLNFKPHETPRTYCYYNKQQIKIHWTRWWVRFKNITKSSSGKTRGCANKKAVTETKSLRNCRASHFNNIMFYILYLHLFFNSYIIVIRLRVNNIYYVIMIQTSLPAKRLITKQPHCSYINRVLLSTRRWRFLNNRNADLKPARSKFRKFYLLESRSVFCRRHIIIIYTFGIM